MMYVISGRDAQYYPELIEQAFELRRRIFIEELKWDMPRADAKFEIDQFDTDDAIHHLSVRDGRVVGYQRMLPSDKPHLLTDLFPQLCKIDSPKGPDIYELTRYCVDRPYRQSRREVGSVGSELMVGFIEWGLASGIRKVIIEFETIWVLRAIQLGFFVQPLGLETQIGNQKIVASLANFDEATLQTVRRYRGTDEPVVQFLGSLAKIGGHYEAAL
ncbi:GNAT family N-acetyltransferase [Martelella alba]|uniref:Acyl-homoserine-lactone synthase n=1 Tax=Martelella alba TaxID=2590451 RepID=A0A506U268_9HYPH|nr:acyl-homoserine-lactone synthase [Martelella alba]TPW27075.1 GNAT family N-acetyltransferase [Martelella alba]